MKAIVCSRDGVPIDVAVVNDGEAPEEVRRNISATKQYDRVDLVYCTPDDVLQTTCFKAALGIEDPEDPEDA